MMPPSKFSSFSTVLHWYQKKLGSYDQQLWEKTVEERVLRGIGSAIPKKVTRVKTDLIDLDLIRGSAFSRSKPKQGRLATTCLGILRLIFYPFCLIWWTEQTNSTISSSLLLLYALQFSSMYIYLNPDYNSDLTCSINDASGDAHDSDDEIPASEVFFPVIMFMILSVIQSHIAASHSLDQKQSSSSLRATDRNTTRSQSASQKVTNEASTTAGNNGNNNISRKSNVKRKKRSPDKQKNKKNGVTQSSNAETTDKENDVPKRSTGSHDDDERLAANNNCNNGSSLKASDEESGLEIPEFCDPISSGRIIMSNLSVNGNGRTESQSRSPATSSRHVSRSCDRAARTGAADATSACHKSDEQMTGEEGDQEQEDCADLSSLDEISPYSTVNSESWRRYSDIISQRIRSLSQSRRFSATAGEDGSSSTCRPRSNTHVVKHSHRCRFSPAAHHQHSHSHPDMINISSNDSEASVSPTPLNKQGNTELDWPMTDIILNSEGTSDDEDEPVARSGIFHHHVSDDAKDPIFSGNFYDMEQRQSCDGSRAERVSCAIWQQFECQKVDLSVVDISSAVIRKAEKARHSNEYLLLAIGIALALSAIPALFRLQNNKSAMMQSSDNLLPSVVVANVSQERDAAAIPSSISQSAMIELMQSLLSQVPVPDPGLMFESLVASNCSLLTRYIVIVAAIERFFMSIFFFFLLCVAEHTYRERFMFAKYFCRLTSARRALGSDLPHFRLNKVRNIKTWLSVRSYLKKHGPQRSVDIIVSGGFILAVCILTFLCVQLLRETDTCSSRLHCWEMVSWDLGLGIYILRLMVLGIKTNRKYKSNLSVLITEQINLYLQLEQKPHKKEELTLANHVLKLAADLLKQLETPFKISGFSANHYLYNVTKVVVLSAFSAVLTEMLGFKLKLHKIKL